MYKKTKLIDINDFLNQLNHPLEEIIEELRGIILSANKEITFSLYRWSENKKKCNNWDSQSMAGEHFRINLNFLAEGTSNLGLNEQFLDDNVFW